MRTGGFFFFKIQGGGGGSLVTGDVGFMSMMRDGLLDGRLDVIRTLMDGIEVLLYTSFLLSFSPLFFFFLWVTPSHCLYICTLIPRDQHGQCNRLYSDPFQLDDAQHRNRCPKVLQRCNSKCLPVRPPFPIQTWIVLTQIGKRIRIGAFLGGCPTFDWGEVGVIRPITKEGSTWPCFGAIFRGARPSDDASRASRSTVEARSSFALGAQT